MTAVAEPARFPCVLTLHVPFPTARLASIALRAIQVDKELSPLVQRRLSLASCPDPPRPAADAPEPDIVLKVEYRATTNRMLRVAVNSFMESLSLVLEVMEQLDIADASPAAEPSVA